MSIVFAQQRSVWGFWRLPFRSQKRVIRMPGTNSAVPLLHFYATCYSLITVIKGLLKSVVFKTTCAKLRSTELDVHSAGSNKPLGNCIECSDETSFNVAPIRQGWSCNGDEFHFLRLFWPFGNCWLFTIYMGKPFGSWFGQLVK